MKHASACNVIKRCFGLDPIEAELGEGLPSNVIDDEEPKGNEFQKKMLRWLPVWSTCTMLEPLTQIQDLRLII
ncbi:hypothetical protein Gotur_005013 [Gossypium turneri]